MKKTAAQSLEGHTVNYELKFILDAVKRPRCKLSPKYSGCEIHIGDKSIVTQTR